MASLNDLIRAYQYYKASTFLIGLNNVLKCRRYSGGKLNPKLLENIIIGGHQHRLRYHPNVNYRILKRDVRKAFATPFPILSPPTPYKDFEDIYDELKKRLCPKGKYIKGIGDTTLYDISLRIGYILLPEPVFPNNKLYLYNGAFEGYCELQKISPLLCPPISSLPVITKPDRYDMSSFSGIFDPLPSMFVEDLLCVYHTDFPILPSLTFDDLQKKLCCGNNVPQIYKI